MVELGSPNEWPKRIVIYTDGASRGNPGAAAAGVTVLDEDGQAIYEFGQKLGDQTNNYAEYTAVKLALELTVKNSVDQLELKSDSEFLVKQLNGLYKVKSANIKPLYEECKKLLGQIPNFKVEHVRREYNKRADELANLALDEV